MMEEEKMSRENGQNITVHITEEQLDQRIAEIGAAITEQFKGESVYLVCILRGSIFFTTELAKRIDLPVEIDFMTVSSYGAQTVSSGKDYTALIEKVHATTSITERAALLHEAEEMLLADMPVIPVIFNEDAYLEHKDLSGTASTYYGTRIFNDTKQKNWVKYVPEE